MSEDLSVFIDEELLEVPRDVGAVAITWLGLFQQLVQRRSGVAVHLDLGEHGEVHIKLRRCEFKDLGVGAGLLVGELVAREAEHDDIVVVIMKRTQTCVLRREASSAGDVDDQADLVLEPIERHLVARDRGHLEVVEA